MSTDKTKEDDAVKECAEGDGFLSSEEQTVAPSRPKWWKLQLFAVYCVFLCQGLSNSLKGPPMVDMETVLGTGTAGMATALTLDAVGQTVGAAFSAALYPRLQVTLQLAVENCLMASSIILAPWSQQLYVFYAFMVLRGFTNGLADPTSQAYLLELMTNHRFRNPSVLLLHASWSFGGFIGPLIIQPFLSSRSFTEDESCQHNCSTPLYNGYHNTSLMGNHTTIYTANPPITTHVQYAYLCVGCVILFLTVPMWIAWGLSAATCRKKKEDEKKSIEHENAHNETRFYRIVLHTLLFLYFLFALWTDNLSSAFLAPFVIKGLGWPRPTGPLITSVLYAANGVGRLVSVPLSVYASPRQLLVLGLSLTGAGFILLLSLHSAHQAVVWVSAGVAGFGMSFNFASGLVWAAQHMHVSGPSASVFLVGAFCGCITGPLFTGYMFEYYSPMWLIYIILSAVTFNVILLVVMELYVKFRSKVPEQLEMDVDVTEKNSVSLFVSSTVIQGSISSLFKESSAVS